MPFARPSLADLVTRIRADFKSRLSIQGELVRRAMAKVLGDVWAGATHMLHGNLEFLSRQIFATTSERDFLIIHAAVYDFVVNPATFSQGNVRATGTNLEEIPAGTIFVRDDGFTYTSDNLETINLGAAIVEVTAVLAGIDGNMVDNETLQFETPIPLIDATVIVEPDPNELTGGFDEEETEAFRIRFLEFLQEPPMGGTDPDYVAFAKGTDGVGVTRVFVFRHENGLGTVTVRFMVDDPVTGDPVFPSAPQVALVQTEIDSQRPITAEITVEAPVDDPIAFTISITPDTASTQAAVEDQLDDLFFRGEPGDGVSRGTVLLSQMQLAIGLAEGVTDYTLTVPAADVVPALGDLPTRGVVTFV